MATVTIDPGISVQSCVLCVHMCGFFSRGKSIHFHRSILPLMSTVIILLLTRGDKRQSEELAIEGKGVMRGNVRVVGTI